jgi:predicted amidohydrolase YtcJ
MKKYFFQLLAILLIVACGKSRQNKIDTILYNAEVHVMDSLVSPQEAIAIHEGKVVFVGSDQDVKNQYTATEVIDMQGKHIYPGWHDAHAHFWGYGMTLQQVDLSKSKSWEEVLLRCSLFYQTNKPELLTGRGWDQNVWPNKSFPTNDQLNTMFPDIPVLLKRIDGHAAIANDYLLRKAGITLQTKISGGEIVRNGNKLSGVLIDNAIDLATAALPPVSHETHVRALLAAQDTCLSYGLTTITDAGLPTSTILIIDSLSKAGLLKIRLNCMVSIDDEAINYWLKRGVYETDHLRIGSFKMYADGALGSRGACLIEKYHDANHKGMIITDPVVMQQYIGRLAKSAFQLNTHCIGDSANRTLLKYQSAALGKNNNRRWRIEHAQVLHPSDYSYFKDFGIIPSVQPTHATSDMYWADKRLGNERIKHAYAYQTLLHQNGWMPLGTDFPVEQVNPMLTLYAATQRKDASGFPKNGFEFANRLTYWQTFYGMTIWAAKGAFWENKLGNIEPGKWADLVVYESDLQSISANSLIHIRPTQTYLSGKIIK